MAKSALGSAAASDTTSSQDLSATDQSSLIEQEVAYMSGVDASGNAAVENWWQYQSSFPRKWGASTPGSPGGAVAYSFYPDYYWTLADQARVSDGLALWAAVANIAFQQVPYSSSTPAPITFYYRPDEVTATGTVGFPTGNDLTPDTIGTLVSGGTFFDPPQIGLVGPLGSFTWTGGYGVDTILHEEGHLLGLGGSGQYNSTIDPATQQFGPYDSRSWTVMSYINPTDTTARYHSYYDYPSTDWGVDVDGYPLAPTTWMPLDIFAIQRLYGLPSSTPLSGGQIFGFHCNVAGPIEPFFDFTINSTPVVTLWDEGTGNTLDVSGFTAPASIDLRPGTFSSVDGLTDNIAIAFATAIDAVVGGSGATQFTVNGDSDRIVGGSGQDTVLFPTGSANWTGSLAGGAGGQVLRGSGVADTLVGIAALDFAGGNDTVSSQTAGAVTLAGTGNELFLGAGEVSVALGNADTVVGGAGALAVTASGASSGSSPGNLIWDTSGQLEYVAGSTNDTVVAGSATVSAGSGALAAYGQGASLVFAAGTGYAIAVASAGVLDAQGGAGGAVLVGGSAGGNVLTAGAGQTLAFAGGAGDLVSLNEAASGVNDIAVLARGAETVQGSGNATGFAVYTEAANALVIGGPGDDDVDFGSGASTVLGGGGINAFVFVNGSAGGHDVLADWDPSHDYIFLIGYGAGADQAALDSQAVVGGSTVVTLPDLTQITFVGVAGIGHGSFF